MARSGGISGLGVALAAAGGFLVFSGIRDVPILTGLRELTQGKAPTGSAPKPSRTSGLLDGLQGYGSANAAEHALETSGGTHPEIAQAALKYVGVPYVFASADPKRGLDCSGLVIRAFLDVGGPKLPHSAAAQVALPIFRKVSRVDCGAGDLVWWPGHIGIAVDNQRGVFAPRPGKSVQVTPIDSSGPVKGAPKLIVRWTGGK